MFVPQVSGAAQGGYSDNVSSWARTLARATLYPGDLSFLQPAQHSSDTVTVVVINGFMETQRTRNHHHQPVGVMKGININTYSDL